MSILKRTLIFTAGLEAIVLRAIFIVAAGCPSLVLAQSIGIAEQTSAQAPVLFAPLPGEPYSQSDVFRFSMQAASSPTTEPEPGQQHSLLPFLAQDARDRGYDVPEPFGFSPLYNYLQRDITISDLRIGLNGASPRSVSKFVDVGSHVVVNGAIGRADVFVFPFLDAYALCGYLHEESTTSGIATIPLPGPTHPTRSIGFSGVTKIDGFVTGLGLDAATGYKEFFISADANYTVTDLGFDDHFRALLVSLRTGWNGKIGRIPVRVWTGLEYWNSSSTAASTVTLANGQRLSFAADQGPTNPVNALFGISIQPNRNFGMLVEYGTDFNDMQLLAASLEFRF